MISLSAAIAIGIVSNVVAATVVFLLVTTRRDRRFAGTLAVGSEDDVAFLFRNGRLVDATPAARAQMPAEPKQTDDLGRFVLTFGQRFEGLAARLADAADVPNFQIPEVPDDPESLRLVVESRNGQIRAAIHDPLRGTRSEVVAHYSLAAMRAELFTLRSIAERSPIPTWKRRHDGTIIWANSTYMTLARSVAGAEALIGWPPPDVFDDGQRDWTEEPEAPRRISVQPPGRGQRLWFDLIALPGEIETLFFALPIDKLVRAENALTEFVQTLTKTFADLRVGLAIFDRKRKLVLFNPALVDLTGLPPEHLSARPTLHAFLDTLRDRQRIPEPKDYKSWRMQVAQLEAGAADGTFEETWHLPNGQTFRVSGRPHPDGAVAYLFEDISSEVRMSRTYRSEIELSQSVFDNLDTAIAAFSQTGMLSLSNRAYGALWSGDGGHRPAETGIAEAARRWQEQCHPSAELDAVRATVLQKGERQGWTGYVEKLDGTLLRCDVKPVAGGASLVTFAKVGGRGQRSTPAERPGERRLAI